MASRAAPRRAAGRGQPAQGVQVPPARRIRIVAPPAALLLPCQAPVDVVLFEGWMLGFAPVDDEAAAAVDPSLAPVNAFLRRWGNNCY